MGNCEKWGSSGEKINEAGKKAIKKIKPGEKKKYAYIESGKEVTKMFTGWIAWDNDQMIERQV